MNRSEYPELIFSWFVEAGEELGMREIRVRARKERLRLSSQGLRLMVRRLKKTHADRWHEIYDKKLGVVHTPAPKPKKAKTPEPAPAPEPAPEIDPLEALSKARAKKEEEHE